jgi:predicted RNA-binding Zn-ribbon protein involved in translation (DUF1610 family)
MARPMKRERRLVNLQCNNCGHHFEGQAWFESIEGERGTTGWVRARDGTSGITCPACGSELIGFGKH